LPEQGLEDLLLLALGRQLERWQAAFGRQGQEFRQQRPVLRRGQGELRELVQLCLRRVLALESRRALELRDERVESTVLALGRAEIAHAAVRLALDLLVQGGGEARLAYARLAGDQHDPAFTTLRAVPLAQEQVHLFLTPDQGRERRPVQRL